MTHFTKARFTKMAGAAVLAGTLGAAASAQASQLIFPYIVGSSTVSTVLTVANLTPAAHPGNGDTQLRYAYMYKAGASATDNDAACARTPTFTLSSATNDVQSFDVSGKFGASTRGVLFNDPSVNNDWNTGSQNWAALSGQNLFRAVGFVDNNNDDTGASYPAPYLYGEAFIFEFGSGAAWGYQALDDKGTGGAIDVTKFYQGHHIPFSFLDAYTRFAFMPTTEFSTRFFVTPIIADMDDVTLQGRVEVYPYVNTDQVAYDRDGNPVGGYVSQTVTCVGGVDIEEMMSGAATTALQNGGWSRLAIVPPSVAAAGTEGTLFAHVIKLEFNKGSTFNGQAMGGTFNNSIVLRNPRGIYIEE